MSQPGASNSSSEQSNPEHHVMMSEPRGRLFQDLEFEIPFVVGRSVEKLIGCTERADGGLAIVFLKATSLHWQRSFVDTGVGFWEEWGQTDTFADFDTCHFRRVDLGRQFGITGREIVRARFESRSTRGEGPVARFLFDLSEGTVELAARGDDVIFPSFTADPR